jgi:hypothetical protein
MSLWGECEIAVDASKYALVLLEQAADAATHVQNCYQNSYCNSIGRLLTAYPDLHGLYGATRIEDFDVEDNGT